MSDLSRLGIGLTVVFVISLIALFTELCYLFCRRKKQTNSPESQNSGEILTTSTISSSSKHLLYYLFCFKNKSRTEPNVASTTIHPINDEQQDELVKWREMQEIQGPSRVLFTIKEEEKEDLESEKSCSDRKFRTKGSYSLNDEEVVMMSMEREIESPFFTPCGSPPYYSPSSSPPREVKHLKEIDCCFVVRIDELQRKVGERDSHGD